MGVRVLPAILEDSTVGSELDRAGWDYGTQLVQYILWNY